MPDRISPFAILRIKTVLQKMIRAIAVATLACLVSCNKGSPGHVPSKVKPLLSQSELTQLGFMTKAVRVSVQSQWDQAHFGSASVVEQDIRSLTPMAENSSTFPRFTVAREIYDQPVAASNRIKTLRDHDPDLNDKMNARLVLRDGFATGEIVWIVKTDAVIFSYQELQKVKSNLEALKKPRAEQDSGGNGG